MLDSLVDSADKLDKKIDKVDQKIDRLDHDIRKLTVASFETQTILANNDFKLR